MTRVGGGAMKGALLVVLFFVGVSLIFAVTTSSRQESEAQAALRARVEAMRREKEDLLRRRREAAELAKLQEEHDKLKQSLDALRSEEGSGAQPQEGAAQQQERQAKQHDQLIQQQLRLNEDQKPNVTPLPEVTPIPPPPTPKPPVTPLPLEHFLKSRVNPFEDPNKDPGVDAAKPTKFGEGIGQFGAIRSRLQERGQQDNFKDIFQKHRDRHEKMLKAKASLASSTSIAPAPKAEGAAAESGSAQSAAGDAATKPPLYNDDPFERMKQRKKMENDLKDQMSKAKALGTKDPKFIATDVEAKNDDAQQESVKTRAEGQAGEQAAVRAEGQAEVVKVVRKPKKVKRKIATAEDKPQAAEVHDLERQQLQEQQQQQQGEKKEDAAQAQQEGVKSAVENAAKDQQANDDGNQQQQQRDDAAANGAQQQGEAGAAGDGRGMVGNLNFRTPFPQGNLVAKKSRKHVQVGQERLKEDREAAAQRKAEAKRAEEADAQRIKQREELHAQVEKELGKDK